MASICITIFKQIFRKFGGRMIVYVLFAVLFIAAYSMSKSYLRETRLDGLRDLQKKATTDKYTSTLKRKAVASLKAAESAEAKEQNVGNTVSKKMYKKAPPAVKEKQESPNVGHIKGQRVIVPKNNHTKKIQNKDKQKGTAKNAKTKIKPIESAVDTKATHDSTNKRKHPKQRKDNDHKEKIEKNKENGNKPSKKRQQPSVEKNDKKTNKNTKNARN